MILFNNTSFILIDQTELLQSPAYNCDWLRSKVIRQDKKPLPDMLNLIYALRDKTIFVRQQRLVYKTSFNFDFKLVKIVATVN